MPVLRAEPATRSARCSRRRPSRWCPSSIASAAAASTFRGRDVRLAPNMAGDPSPLHGQGWLAPWQVEHRSDARGRAAASSIRPANGRGLMKRGSFSRSTKAACDAASPAATRRTSRCPAGSASIPISTAGPTTRIDTGVNHVWTIDEHVLPVDEVPATGRFDLADRTSAATASTMASAAGAGRARVDRPRLAVRGRDASPGAPLLPALFARAGRHLRRRAGHPCQCRLSAPEAEWPELGMRVLEPGETMELDRRLEVSARNSRRRLNARKAASIARFRCRSETWVSG